MPHKEAALLEIADLFGELVKSIKNIEQEMVLIKDAVELLTKTCT